MRIKTSNLLILLGLAFFAIALIASTLRLRQEAAKVDFSDPYRNYQKIELPAFQRLVLRTGYADSSMNPYHMRRARFKTQISSAEKPMLLLLKQVSDSLHWDVKDGTLTLSGFNRKLELDPDMAVLMLRTPVLEQVEVAGAAVAFEEFKTDSLRLLLAPVSTAEIAQSQIGYLYVRVEDQSDATLQPGTTVQSMHAELKRRATLNCNDVLPGAFTHEVSPESEITVKGRATAMFLR
ncbi:MAG: hypothetical protein IT260_23450 [Saprospiraceae bacterium]|nr:hypothetical protein [Saprospiraceae bacterium]